MQPSPPPKVTDTGELARAKVNLCLHVTGRRPDGYHLLDSLVVFPALGDVIHADPAKSNSMTLAGPFGLDLSGNRNNLVMKAASLMPGAKASILLEKNLPIASGIGGGSADAAATMRAMARLNGGRYPDADAILSLGADVPVCIASVPARMRGIGDRVDALPDLPAFWCVLANPRVQCPTPAVFGALLERSNPPVPDLPARFATATELFAFLRGLRNDLERPAVALRPQIGQALEAVRGTEGCALARMSGSGATVFGLYSDEAAALMAADRIRAAHPDWWIAAAPV